MDKISYITQSLDIYFTQPTGTIFRYPGLNCIFKFTQSRTFFESHTIGPNIRREFSPLKTVSTLGLINVFRLLVLGPQFR